MKHFFNHCAAAVASTFALVGCQTAPPMGTNESESQVRGALQAWSAAFNACDVEKLAALYAPDAVLWGTVSQALISNSEGVREYFQRACSTRPQPKVVLGDLLVRPQGESAVSSGIYTFTLTIQGQPRTLPARFTFTYRKSGSSWLIASHHSSLMPATPAASAPAR